MYSEDLDRRIDEQKVQLSQFVTGVKFKFGYEYDFGDCWGHEIIVEKILKCDPKIIYPICLKGKRACPPEDCGGAWAYPDMLKALKNPSHPDHRSIKEWINVKFEPEDFNLDAVNKRLVSCR